MGKQGALKREEIVGFVDSLYEGDLHAKRVQSLANATLGVVTSASLAVHAIGHGLAHAQGLVSKHAIKQVDRLVSNRGIDVAEFFARWVPHVVGERKSVVVALDWTSFKADGQSTIALSMLTGHGRATPLLWKTVKDGQLKGHQTDFEDELLVRLREVLPEGVAVTVVADRGFEDCKLFEFLSTELGFDYVVRTRGHIYITAANGERRQASQWVGVNGRARTLRGAAVTDSHSYRVATVVCVKAKGMKEPWCLAASDPHASAKTLTGYYAKRWGIETSFRDIKDLRFGMGLKSVRVSKPERRDRLLLLSALAIALLSLLGAAGESLGYDRMLKANTVKKRTHSLLRQGLMLYNWMPNMREEHFRPLLERYAEMLIQQSMFQEVFGVI